MDHQLMPLAVVALCSKSLDETVENYYIVLFIFLCPVEIYIFCHGILVAAIISTQICILCHVCDLI